MDCFVVLKSLTRKYGYSIQAPSHVTWAKGPQNTFGWYRRKSDAQNQADAHNRATNETEEEMIAMKKPMFNLGQVVATPGAIEALEQAEQLPWEFLSRHIAGDWGVLSIEDKEANDEALKDGSRILSAYLLKTGVKIWVITEATDDDGNRAATTLLLPDEY